MAYYTIHLIGVDIVRPPGIVRQVVAAAFGPLIEEAGHEVNIVEIVTGRQEQTTPDVSVQFTRDLRGLAPNDRVLAEQSGGVLVGAILNMRVGSPLERGALWRSDPRHPGEREPASAWTSHAESARLLWRNGEHAFARTVGNIAVHELGHTIGGLSHHRDPTNYMFTGASIARVLGPRFRTYENLRRMWSGPHDWAPSQRQRLVEAIRAGELRGFEVSALRQAP